MPTRAAHVPIASVLYFAYGSNLLKAGMLGRCPAAVAIGPALLPDHRLVFRSWADVEPAPGSRVAGALWRLTPACLAALDDYEEVDAGLYRRVSVVVETEVRQAVEALTYRMSATTLAPPAPGYLEIVLAGCRDFGLDGTPVLAAARSAASRRPERRPA